MKLLRSFLGLAITLSSIMVCAQSSDLKEASRAEGSSVSSGGSLQNRLDKDFTIQLQPVGLSAIGTNESLLILGYYIDSNNILQLEAGAGRSDFEMKWDGQSEDKEVLKGESVGLHYKHFFGNSFYVKLGADYRGIKYTGKILDPHFASIDGTSGVASIVVGNQWQWKTWTAGCDWIGGGLPFATFVSSTNGSAADVAAAKKKYLEDAFVQGLRIYVGATF